MIITEYEAGWAKEIQKTTTGDVKRYKVGAHAPSVIVFKTAVRVSVSWSVESGGAPPDRACIEQPNGTEECRMGEKYVAGPGEVKLRIEAKDKNQRWTYWEVVEPCES